MLEVHELCAKCSVRKGTLKWSGEMGSVMAFRVFNSLPMWCERCVVREQLAYAEKSAAKIPELKAKLEELEKNE